MSTERSSQNPTGHEMVEELQQLDAVLADSGLTPDAEGPLREKREALHGKFTGAAEYAAQLATATNTEFPNPLAELDAEAEDAAESEVDLWSLLSPERQEKARKKIAAMAEKFGVKEEDFSLLKTTNEAEEDIFTAVYSAGNGLYKGSWNTIQSNGRKNKAEFEVVVDGETVDTRKGMTRVLGRELIADAARRGVTLPDSQELATENDQPWTLTLLTGEKPGEFNAPFVNVLDGRVHERWVDRAGDRQDIRFRPAAEV